jgi:class 3 adenylate cyclase/tetratricopeptide (TPR) repeat protein
VRCPNCGYENPDGKKFCRECGAKLALICPHCGGEILPGDKFCGECGHNLTLPSKPRLKDLSFDEKLEKIQKYLPKGLTEKILSQRNKIEGERKQVTVMFCDMEGFTPLVEKLGPEDAYGIMDQVYEILIHKVHDYDGTVNEMTGDGIMALFGAPIALEDAPQRAIRSALAIHREMARFNDTIRHEKKAMSPLKMRIGIHTGPVVVGTLGNDLRVEFKAVGDTVNLASRMEGLAEPATTYVTGETFKLTEGLFRFEALGEKQIKGKEEPVNVYHVLAPSTRRTRFDVSAERGLTPFVGRERELELLLDSFQRVKAGRGQAISIMSEAGMGKSRLLYELRKAVANEDITFLEGKCLSYSRGISYHPIIDVLRANFDINEADGDSKTKEKVKEGLKILKVDESSTLPYLLELLSVKDSGIDKIMMSPEGKKDQINEALKRIVLKASEIRLLVMAFEDLHWMDKSSEEVLKFLLESIPGARILLIFTYRPEFVHTWGAKSYHNQLTLSRLSNRESLAMVFHLLGTENLDSNIEELILEKTEGVPFFIEEFIRSFIDLKLIEREDNTYRLIKGVEKLTIPSTIQDVIMARVDSLPEGSKEILQTGSVIEREFTYELIKQVTGLLEKELLSHISALKDLELLYERGIYPESTYIFKHALTREVVYNSILAKKKKQLHYQIGDAIEKLYTKTIDEYYSLLAEHYIEGEDYEKGAEYLRFASKKAAKKGSLSDAIAQAEKRIVCLERLPETGEIQKKIIDARATLGMYYNQVNNFVLSKEAVDPVVELAHKLDYKRRIAQIYTILGSYVYAVEEDYSKASDQLQEAINAAEATGDLISLVMANHWIGHALADNCEFDRSLHHLDKGLKINTMTNVLWGISAHKSCIARTVYLWQGKVNVGYPMSCEGLQTAVESGDSYSMVEAHISMGWAYLERRQLNDAEKHLTEACDICDRLQFILLHCGAECCLGETYFWMEKYSKSKIHFASAARVLNSNSIFPSLARLCLVAMARAKVMNNEKITDLDLLIAYTHKNRPKLLKGKIRRHIAEILLYLDDSHMGEVEKWIYEAIEADRQNGLLFDLAMDLAVAGELYKRRGERSKAKKIVSEAMNIFKECGADGWVEKYEGELAELS